MAFVQRRKGSDVVGSFGLLQPLVDGLKLIIKEPISPSSANFSLFRMALVATFMLSLVARAVEPFDYVERVGWKFKPQRELKRGLSVRSKALWTSHYRRSDASGAFKSFSTKRGEEVLAANFPDEWISELSSAFTIWRWMAPGRIDTNLPTPSPTESKRADARFPDPLLIPSRLDRDCNLERGSNN
ncbi:NADH:ubiquinone dehydrogenase subunit 1 [Datura stramonium]|uniref:NADH:ubiquinone dehydrogenase subunit 1 n=1 Tax=Datura stramonium TaxID=4076 RepID=A0ABS8VMW6_DATST|nr:NADH:ubiquinone dehydrogenase subunit 1 [Datura stramonium]